MSFAEVLAEIPRLTPEQRQEVLRRVADAEAKSGAAAGPPDELRAKWIGGRLLLTGQRMVTQAEVDAILADFP